MKSGKTYTLKIDGVSFDISNVTSIGTTSDSGTGNTSSGSSLGELIARASMMIGMSATVNPGVEGGSLLDSGIISSIQVKDGQVRVIINDKGYLLEDIVEVAYPKIDSGDDNTSDKTEDSTDKTEDSTDKTGDVTDKEDSGTQEQSAEALSYAAAQTDISDLEEVTGEIIPDRTVGEDIADLEDLI